MPDSPAAVALLAANLIFLAVGAWFAATEAARLFRARALPAGTLAPWRATGAELVFFFVAFVIAFVALPQLGFVAARAVFPDVDLAANPVYAVGFYQPLVAAFVWGAFSGRRVPFGDAFLEKIRAKLADGWNAAGAPPALSRLAWRSRENAWAFFGLALLVVFVASALSQCVPAVFPELKDAWARDQILVDNLRSLEHPWALALFVPALVAFTPFVEEVFFRAGLYRFLKAKTGGVPAALLTGLCFALAHDSWAGVLPLAALSCVLCLAYERTGRLAVPVLIHGLFNLNSLLQILADK